MLMHQIQNKLQRTQVEIVEGQLVANLLTNLIKGNEPERKLAILLLKSKAPSTAEIILPLLSKKDRSEDVRQLADREFKDLRFSTLLKDAEIFLELKRYQLAAEFFHKAVKFAERSKLNLPLLEAAESRYQAKAYQNASEIFSRVFDDYF